MLRLSPQLLLGYDTASAASVTRIDQIFDELDNDCSGALTFDELSDRLRHGLAVELRGSLLAGAIEFDV